MRVLTLVELHLTMMGKVIGLISDYILETKFFYFRVNSKNG